MNMTLLVWRWTSTRLTCLGTYALTKLQLAGFTSAIAFIDKHRQAELRLRQLQPSLEPIRI